MTTQRVTRSSAAKLKGLSLSTIDRHIRDGKIEVERDMAGGTQRVWVLLPEDDGEPFSDDMPEYSPDLSVIAELRTQIAVLEEQVKARDDLVVMLREQLAEASARDQMLMNNLDQAQRLADGLSHRMLPAAPQGKRRWWPFGSSGT